MPADDRPIDPIDPREPRGMVHLDNGQPIVFAQPEQAKTPPAVGDLRAHLVESLLASWSVADDRVSKTMATLAAGRDVGTILAALEAHDVMADVEDALSYVIETSPHDTSRFRRAHEALFPNTPKDTDDE